MGRELRIDRANRREKSHGVPSISQSDCRSYGYAVATPAQVREVIHYNDAYLGRHDLDSLADGSRKEGEATFPTDSAHPIQVHARIANSEAGPRHPQGDRVLP